MMEMPPLPERAAVFPRIVLPEVHGMGPNTMVMKEWDMFDAEQMRAYAKEWGESCARMAREEAAKLCEELASSGENSDSWTVTRDLAFRACAAAIRKG